MENMALESINLNELAYNEIKKRIIRREFVPGQRLVDSQLAAMFKISRTPIRDAMRRLVEEGLLINTSARGFYVFSPTLKDIDEIFSVSSMIELEAATRIIRTLQENPSEELEEKLRFLEAKANNVFPMENDEEFKRYLIELADNQRLYDIYLQNQGQRVLLANIIHYGWDQKQEWNRFRGEKSRIVHNQIVLGIKNQDLEYTRKAIEEHTRYGIEDATKYVKNLNK